MDWEITDLLLATRFRGEGHGAGGRPPREDPGGKEIVAGGDAEGHCGSP